MATLKNKPSRSNPSLGTCWYLLHCFFINGWAVTVLMRYFIGITVTLSTRIFSAIFLFWGIRFWIGWGSFGDERPIFGFRFDYGGSMERWTTAFLISVSIRSFIKEMNDRFSDYSLVTVFHWGDERPLFRLQFGYGLSLGRWTTAFRFSVRLRSFIKEMNDCFSDFSSVKVFYWSDELPLFWFRFFSSVAVFQ